MERLHYLKKKVLVTLIALVTSFNAMLISPTIPVVGEFAKVGADPMINVGLPCVLNTNIYPSLANVNSTRWHVSGLGGEGHAVDLQNGDECASNDVIASISGTITISELEVWGCPVAPSPVKNTMVEITNSSGVKVRYYHNNKDYEPTVNDGYIQAGEKIATIGAVGCADGEHIHFEVRPSDVLKPYSEWQFGSSYSGGVSYDDIPIQADYDGDGKIDLAAYTPSASDMLLRDWHVIKSKTNTVWDFQHGNGSDTPVTGHFDNDDKADLGLYRSGTWIIFLSEFSYAYANRIELSIGLGKPVPADYDGDGKTDIAIFADDPNNPGHKIWKVRKSQDSQIWTVPHGDAGDIPVPGNYDIDNQTHQKADFGIYRNGLWSVLLSSNSYSGPGRLEKTHGNGSDKPVPADYDGDGKFDLGLYRGGDWIVLLSEQNYEYGPNLHLEFEHGFASDTPVTGDFNDDGFADLTIYRQSEKKWHTYLTPISTSRAVDFYAAWGGAGAPNSLPSWQTTIPAREVSGGQTFSTFDLNDFATDADVHDRLTFTYSGNQNIGISIDSNNVVTATYPQNWYGEESVTFIATDRAEVSMNKNIVFKVLNSGTPTFTSSPVTSVTAFTTYTYDVNATDSNNDPLTYLLASAPGGMTINETTGVITWIPKNSVVGNNSVVVRVSDGQNTNDQTFSINVSYISSKYTNWDVTETNSVYHSGTPVPADYDGDGKDDIAVFRDSSTHPGLKEWKVKYSSNGQNWSMFLGVTASKPVVGYYDNDNKADIGIYTDGDWLILLSTNNYQYGGNQHLQVMHGNSTDKPVPADYDGDGKTDLGIYRNGTWIVLQSGSSYSWAGRFEMTHGNSTDVPFVGYFDRDPGTYQKADIGIYRDGNWIIFLSTASYSYSGRLEKQNGITSDKIVPADYDGDGKDDMGIFRSGRWVVIVSGKNYVYADRIDVTLTDGNFVPAPADYNGDGRDDAAVKHNSSNWYLDYAAN